jgi:5-formyltetrahydrofolate cyclo-ligase
MKSKSEIRREIKSLRANLSERQRYLKSRDIVQNFYANIPVGKNDIIAGYTPFQSEVDINLLLEMYSERGNKICLPVVEEENAPLIFREYKIGDKLIKNEKFGFLEPEESAQKMLPNIIITPLVAFDAAGFRLGQGGGFYDRTIEYLLSVGEIMTVGVAFVLQQIPKVPHESFDQKLDAIVTEERVIVC